MNAFLNQLARPQSGPVKPAENVVAVIRASKNKPSKSNLVAEALLLPRDRALLELLYAAGLRVSELTGLNLVDIDLRDRVLRGNKERIVPYGSKAQEALEKYWPLREELLLQVAGSRASRRAAPHASAVFLNYAGRRLTQRSVGRIVKKYVRLINVNWDLHPHSLRHAFATHLLAPSRNSWATSPSQQLKNIRMPPSASSWTSTTNPIPTLERAPMSASLSPESTWLLPVWPLQLMWPES